MHAAPGRAHAVSCTSDGAIKRDGLAAPVVFARFFFNDPAPTEIYSLPLPDALPIYSTSTGCHTCAARERSPPLSTGWLARSQNSLNASARRAVITIRNGAGRNCAAHDRLPAGKLRRVGCLRADHVAVRASGPPGRAAPVE